MKVVAFVGPSGTGKSHRAIGIAHKNNCDAIIDDGLLIKGTKILAGTSAKNETNRIQAVKRAIFTEEDHAEAVRQALAGNDVRRLLILATSDNMIEKIVKRLELPEPEKTVYIQQIASKQEIKKAKQARLRDGKHIVPVPTVELKPHFTGYFADLPYNLFSKQRKKSGEDRSIVRPAFSYYGKLLISDYAIYDIINLIAEKMMGIDKVTGIKVRRRAETKGISIYVDVVLYYGVKIFEVTKLLQHKIKEKVEYMTAMQVKTINVSVRSLSVKKQEDFYVKRTKLLVGITAAEMYKVIGVIVVVDMKSGLIVKADCTLATELARQYIAQCLIGYNLSNGHEELQNILERQYQGSAKKAVATAMRIIYDKYRSFKNGESAEGSDKFI